ncbi:hypothetical protein KY289_036194 [Solanum tuberosum]|nr:hypothetical protein KY289_036194 [Solanum tuberosum]
MDSKEWPREASLSVTSPAPGSPDFPYYYGRHACPSLLTDDERFFCVKFGAAPGSPDFPYYYGRHACPSLLVTAPGSPDFPYYYGRHACPSLLVTSPGSPDFPYYYRRHAFKNVPSHILKFLNELFLYLMSIFPANFIPAIKKLLQLMYYKFVRLPIPTGGVNKGRVYELGELPSLCHSSPLLSGASTSQSLEEMEAMHKKISELIERLQTSEANFAKVQKFMQNIWLNLMIPKKKATLMKSSLCYGCLDIFYEIKMSFETFTFVLNHNLILIRLDFDYA